MLDAMNAPSVPNVVHREDYHPPDWLVPSVQLDFNLSAHGTRVHATLRVERNGLHDRPLRLDGDELQPLQVRVDGEETSNWILDEGALLLALDGDAFTIETEVELNPAANTKLMGLYASNGLLCTQCEAEGFRRITFFPDRPDVLSRYHVRMEADREAYPILLCNGDPVGRGELANGRHWVEWNDPFPKPAYLFALVAGDLHANRDSFVTMSGRKVDLAIWVRESDLPKTAHAMAALKTSMKWDEDVYGREYDLAIFNIVAVDDFNFGAMENKGLNIFNSRYILADPDTATDLDYDAILGVVAHEYFHNWSGDRVTCRDWFQLSLKEGFTVFRDQCFSADQGSAAVRRIEDVRMLRASQFQEDAGPLAHPVRPESYIEISNFYTATIYNKGAEVIRMLHTLLGQEKFRAGSDLYFERHDGQAVTCEDFVLAMEEASGVDLGQFRLWYSQAGTPHVKASLTHDASRQEAVLKLEQSVPDTPGQSNKLPMAIPLKIALFNRESANREIEQLEILTDVEKEIRIAGFAKHPVLSINRGFSAPIIVESDRSASDLAFLSAHDDDPFGRYEAMQQLMLDTLVSAVSSGTADHGPVIEAVRNTLTNNALDPAFVAEAVLLPSEAFIGDQMLVVDPDAINSARDALRRDLGGSLEGLWRGAFAAHAAKSFEYSPEAKGSRRLRNVSLGYLAGASVSDAAKLAFHQFETADNMTDRLAALGTLANSDADERVAALDIFYNRYRDNPLVIDKWFTTQALSTRKDTIEAVKDLREHPDFTLQNPNRVRALAGAFSVNQQQFNLADGSGYRFLTDILLELDPINPQTAAKLLPPLGRWRRFDAKRQGLMKAQLERIVGQAGLSKDLYEQASKSLASE
ncbi:aminopeptidase N [Aquisediminimonas profunda]|uniref:aminopeptidase N n=1 Tax=Aquisediminimonas profunda TaxID=1550733 RepID=UPI001C626650|nr:aminopeptidase N [Aquisediminimonas profunda]